MRNVVRRVDLASTLLRGDYTEFAHEEMAGMVSSFVSTGLVRRSSDLRQLPAMTATNMTPNFKRSER